MSRHVIGGIAQLFVQANQLAPDRSKASDGTFPSAEHHLLNPNSDHEPHVVPGVGDQECTAGDFTHDPPRFNADLFAESLRQGRDPRIKYVIRRDRMFSSYPTSKYPAWTWRPYGGVYHGNHAHVSLLDAPISNTRTPWEITVALNLSEDPDFKALKSRLNALIDMSLVNPVGDDLKPEPNKLAEFLIALDAKLDTLLARSGNTVVVPANGGTFSGSVSGQVYLTANGSA